MKVGGTKELSSDDSSGTRFLYFVLGFFLFLMLVLFLFSYWTYDRDGFLCLVSSLDPNLDLLAFASVSIFISS